MLAKSRAVTVCDSWCCCAPARLPAHPSDLAKATTVAPLHRTTALAARLAAGGGASVRVDRRGHRDWIAQAPLANVGSTGCAGRRSSGDRAFVPVHRVVGG